MKDPKKYYFKKCVLPEKKNPRPHACTPARCQLINRVYCKSQVKRTVSSDHYFYFNNNLTNTHKRVKKNMK